MRRESGVQFPGQLHLEIAGALDATFELPLGNHEVTVTHSDGTITRRTIALGRAGAELSPTGDR